jgi:cytoskeletal protein CcmA (bactofilin family)
MFGPKKEGAIEGKLNCIIGEESTFSGEINVRGSVRIDGEFEGAVVATESLFIGKAGVVKADVKVRDLMVAGAISGNLKATERVELHAGARVDGDVETRSLVVDDGVLFNGRCAMQEAAQPAAKSVVEDVQGAIETVRATRSTVGQT